MINWPINLQEFESKWKCLEDISVECHPQSSGNTRRCHLLTEMNDLQDLWYWNWFADFESGRWWIWYFHFQFLFWTWSMFRWNLRIWLESLDHSLSGSFRSLPWDTWSQCFLCRRTRRFLLKYRKPASCVSCALERDQSLRRRRELQWQCGSRTICYLLFLLVRKEFRRRYSSGWSRHPSRFSSPGCLAPIALATFYSAVILC